ncbi:tRNA-specific 2-thiouridylase MnmA [Candidatus Magnetoovum chiemensis]|nr:tRNA-specific 2-thiouridylase MnmA [Candidatus Magnetoovum chiemensis]
MKRVLVGMSGGLDSSICAYLLKSAGYEVIGITFSFWDTRNNNNASICCSLDSYISASNTAKKLGIEHILCVAKGEFIDKVIEPFIDEYKRGNTPNPCVLCNKHIKFPLLLIQAEKLRCDLIATGHYAITVNSPKPVLRKAIDIKKDQSYFLYVLKSEQIEKLILPNGNYTKSQIRHIAYDLGLECADRNESQEICFVQDGQYQRFIGDYLGSMSGPILDINGKKIGAHQGIYNYTIGQRKGLGISAAEPLYVLEIVPRENAIIVGHKQYAMKNEFTINNVTTISNDDAFCITKQDSISVKFRSTMKDEPCMVSSLEGGRFLVRFNNPQWAPARGQSAVFYKNDIVIGGGIIC